MANFSNSGLTFFICTVVFITICGGVIGLRFVAMKLCRRRFYLDDAYILFAYANVVALGGVGMWSCANGLGKPSTILTEYEVAAAAKLLFTAYICWLLASAFYKLAILQLYLRIFTTASFKRVAYVLIGLTVAYTVAFFCVYMTDCVPIDYMWHPTPGGHCRDGQVSDFATLGANMFLDLAILVLPLPTLWSLQLPLRKKMTVTVMLSFGLLTIGVMIWRIIWTQMYRGNPDFVTYLSKIGIVSAFELWLGVIVACIPTLAPLFRTGRFGTANKSNQAGYYGYGSSSGGEINSKKRGSSGGVAKHSRSQDSYIYDGSNSKEGELEMQMSQSSSRTKVAAESPSSSSDKKMPDYYTPVRGADSSPEMGSVFDTQDARRGLAAPMKPDAVYVGRDLDV